MSITPYFDVWCDAEGCIEWTDGGKTRAEAAKQARRNGWKKERDGWKCPGHQRAARLTADRTPEAEK